VVLLSGCSGSAAAPTTSASAVTTTTTVASTSTASSTTSSSTTAPASTTSPLDQFQLSLGGLGEHSFGDPAAKVLPALIQVLGQPDSDDTRDYPSLQPDGTYLSGDTAYSYVAPHGQEACWRTGLCVEFGGGSDTQYTFTGWTYVGGSSVAANQFHTRSRVTVGMTWDQAPAIALDPTFCTGWANGTIDGVHVRLTTSTPPFSAATRHSDATITIMRAGDVPTFVNEDC
jgi:hypothetical protein